MPEEADAALQALSYAPRPVQKAAAHALASPRVYNLVVSNIPGPRIPMYMRGCRLREAFPVVPLSDGHALSVGMTTIGDQACFGLYADPETLPDADALARDLDAEIDALRATMEPWPTPRSTRFGIGDAVPQFALPDTDGVAHAVPQDPAPAGDGARGHLQPLPVRDRVEPAPAQGGRGLRRARRALPRHQRQRRGALPGRLARGDAALRARPVVAVSPTSTTRSSRSPARSAPR